MNEKICYTCKITKTSDQFNKNKSKSDGLNSICKVCSQERSRQYYSDNKVHHIKNITRRKKATIKSSQDYILDYLKQHHCVDCGNDDVRVLEFDHLGDKSYNVSQLISGGYSMSTLITEIAKCEVVCANCHRIRTYTRSGSYRILAL